MRKTANELVYLAVGAWLVPDGRSSTIQYLIVLITPDRRFLREGVLGSLLVMLDTRRSG